MLTFNEISDGLITTHKIFLYITAMKFLAQYRTHKSISHPKTLVKKKNSTYKIEKIIKKSPYVTIKSKLLFQINYTLKYLKK